MDTGQGKFEQVNAENEEQLAQMKRLLEEKYPQHGGWFREGEIVQLKGSTFRVKRIKPPSPISTTALNQASQTNKAYARFAFWMQTARKSLHSMSLAHLTRR